MTNENPRPDREREDAGMRELLGLLREDVRAPAELRDAVMKEITSEQPSWPERLAAWLFTPRQVPVSPALGGLALAVLAGLILVRPAPPAPGGAGSAEAVEPAARVVTRFVLVAPGASSVQVTGDFMSWSPEGIALEDLRGSGIWTADVALPPGVHQYTFVVNGTEWVPDPRAVLQVDDGFGQVNSIVVVPEESQA